MDTLYIIISKTSQLAGKSCERGVNSVLKHVEIAEQHFERACKEQNIDLHTDVIYRTNHAFEGILKEAYSFLTGQSADRVTPYDIETYFVENNIFHSRVMELFTNYRVQWRNPSTHDYQLVFTEQEAFLAILNVSAFISILLDQILERIAYNQEVQNLEGRVESIRESINLATTESLSNKIARLLLSFSDDLKKNIKQQEIPTENQITGALTGYIETIFPSLKINVESNIEYGGRTIRPDFVLEDGEEKVILEIKRSLVVPGFRPKIEHSSHIQQLLHYLEGSQVDNGILFVFPTVDNFSMTTKQIKLETPNGIRNISIISPEIFINGFEA